MTTPPIPPSDDPPVILTMTEGRRIPLPGLEAFERETLQEADRGSKGKHSEARDGERDVYPAPTPVTMTTPPSDDPPVILTLTEGRRIPLLGLEAFGRETPSEAPIEVKKESILCLCLRR
ncbi:hypothetical protein CDAR_534901 [Caerostris darwini]|uniref:Uncharacterized protein n=1 Tax=Caerostris darwini TaxID=1538125 RepID=A0AAV4QJT2_9ARAC|nr:hypothetical protein CDAR_534901 [Caerostris darwini]